MRTGIVDWSHWYTDLYRCILYIRMLQEKRYKKDQKNIKTQTPRTGEYQTLFFLLQIAFLVICVLSPIGLLNACNLPEPWFHCLVMTQTDCCVAMSCDAMRMISRDKQMWNPLMEEVFNSFPERFFVQKKATLLGMWEAPGTSSRKFSVKVNKKQKVLSPVNNMFTSTELSWIHRILFVGLTCPSRILVNVRVSDIGGFYWYFSASLRCQSKCVPAVFWISIVHMLDVPKDTAAPARTQDAQFAWRISRMRWSHIFA